MISKALQTSAHAIQNKDRFAELESSKIPGIQPIHFVCTLIIHCLDKDLTAHALFRSYVILILVHMSSGTKIQNQKKSIEPESGQAVLDTSDQLKKMENDLQDTRSNKTRAPRTDQPSSDHEFVEI